MKITITTGKVESIADLQDGLEGEAFFNDFNRVARLLLEIHIGNVFNHDMTKKHREHLLASLTEEQNQAIEEHEKGFVGEVDFLIKLSLIGKDDLFSNTLDSNNQTIRQ